MGAKAGIPVDEYLHTSFAGLDREYVDGELVERNLPDYLHSRTQTLLTAFFEALRKGSLSVYACSELRVKLREGLFLIPDVCVFWPDAPGEAVPSRPPLIAAEILSPDDRMATIREKWSGTRCGGVPHVWLIDPHSRRLYDCENGLHETQALAIPELGITLTAEDVFD